MAKIQKKALHVTGVILLVVAVVIVAFNIIIAKVIEGRVNNFLIHEHLTNYRIEYKSIGFNILDRSVRLAGLKFLPDSGFLRNLDKSGFNAMAPSITVDKLIVSGIDLRAIIKGRNLIIRKITIKNPVIKLFKFNGKLLSANEKKRKRFSVEDSVRLVGIRGISVRKIIFKKSQLKIYNYKKGKYTLASKDITMVIRGLSFEKSGHGNDYFYPSLREASLVAKDNFLELGNHLYKITFKKLSINLKGESLIFKEFHYKPIYSENAFSKHIKFQKERFDMEAGEIAFSGADFSRFFLENEIQIRKLSISDATIDLFRDKRVPFNHNQRPLLPNQMLKKTKGKFIIDTVQINNTRFEYDEKTDLRTLPVKVWFTGLSGYITNVTNYPYLWQKNKLEVKLKAWLMQQAPLEVRFVFPLAAKNDTFYYRGVVYGPIPFSVFNPAIYPATGLKFIGGVLDKINFRGSANPVYASGTMTMLYRNLDLQAVKKKDHHAANKLLSWGINSFLRKNNPRKGPGKKAKTVSMFVQRNVEKGFGNFFWKTLFSGLKATMLPSVNTVNRKNMQSVAQMKNLKKSKSGITKTRK